MMKLRHRAITYGKVLLMGFAIGSAPFVLFDGASYVLAASSDEPERIDLDMREVCNNLLREYNAPNLIVTAPGEPGLRYPCPGNEDTAPPVYAHMRDVHALKHWESSSADDDGVQVNDSPD